MICPICEFYVGCDIAMHLEIMHDFPFDSRYSTLICPCGYATAFDEVAEMDHHLDDEHIQALAVEVALLRMQGESE